MTPQDKIDPLTKQVSEFRDKYNLGFVSLQLLEPIVKDRTQLQLQCEVMREALKIATVNLVCLRNGMQTGDWDAITKTIDDAFKIEPTTSILSELDRKTKMLEEIKDAALTQSGVCICNMAKEALKPNQT